MYAHIFFILNHLILGPHAADAPRSSKPRPNGTGTTAKRTGGGARPRAQAAPHTACNSSWRHRATIQQNVEGRWPPARGVRAQAPPADPGGVHPGLPARAEADLQLQ